jgi:hypothetical protein
VNAWAQTILFMLLALVFGVFLLLNMHAVIEPRVHGVFFRYEHPALFPVLLLTLTAGFVAALTMRTVSATLREFRATRRRTDIASLEREVAGPKAAPAEAPR